MRRMAGLKNGHALASAGRAAEPIKPVLKGLVDRALEAASTTEGGHNSAAGPIEKGQRRQMQWEGQTTQAIDRVEHGACMEGRALKSCAKLLDKVPRDQRAVACTLVHPIHIDLCPAAPQGLRKDVFGVKVNSRVVHDEHVLLSVRCDKERHNVRTGVCAPRQDWG